MSSFKTRLFADDTALMITDSTLKSLSEKVNMELSKVGNWLNSNKLSLIGNWLNLRIMNKITWRDRVTNNSLYLSDKILKIADLYKLELA